MSHCVPDWDVNDGELDAVLPSTDITPLVKGKWESFPSKRCLHDAVESIWTDEENILAMQGQGSRGNKPMWQQMNYQNPWSAGPESEDAVTPVKPVNVSSPTKEPELEANEPVVDPHQVSTLNLHQDEMVSWLQYPLDDTLEQNYCSDFFGELPSSNLTNIQLLRESFGSNNQATARNLRTQGAGTGGSSSVLSRMASADAAMAMGAGRAAGLLPQAGVEAFTKVRTTMQPQGGKWSPSGSQSSVGKTAGVGPSSQALSPARSNPIPGNLSSPMLPPKSQGLGFPPPLASGPMNFSHFSRPAAKVKANLQCLGMTHGTVPLGSGTSNRLKSQPYSGKSFADACTSSGSSIAESTTTRRRSVAYCEQTDGQPEGSETQQSLGTQSSWPTMDNSLVIRETDAVSSDLDVTNVRASNALLETGRNSTITASAMVEAENRQYHGKTVQENPEPTITSSSGGSGNSAERVKEALSCGKRRTREGEESECQSEVSNLLQPQISQVGAVANRQDGEDEAQAKKSQQRGPTTKRSRAAEVHNLSERRRRDRINEKMKALQELIPNSNKTDKASMLDEAIEYLKMLQLQLQMMSMRSGMSIPPMVMPGGLQHMPMTQLPQMGPISHMGMGMGMGMPHMGMGMTMMDMGGGTSGRPVMPLPSHSGPTHSHNVSATSPAVSMVDTHDHRLQNPGVMQNAGVMDPLNAYIAQQRQMQMGPQPMNMEAYNAFMMHQQQQQHQLQHQHSHPLHHLPSSMGGGGGPH